MAANTQPIFTLTPKTPVGQTILTANTAKDGTGTQVTVFTAGVNGGRVEKLVFIPKGTNIKTVARVWVNNGVDHTQAANNAQLTEAGLPATTLDEDDPMGVTEVPLDIALPASYKLNVSIGTTVAAGWNILAVGGDY